MSEKKIPQAITAIEENGVTHYGLVALTQAAGEIQKQEGALKKFKEIKNTQRINQQTQRIKKK